MKAKTRRNNWVIYLLCTYAGVVLIRFLLAVYTTSFPTVGIDEFLYYSLARSIATEGKLLFRGQSADYSFILYPLILSPVYALFSEKFNFYRLLQLWNIILMSSSVFPLYFLGRKMLKNEKKALTAAALSLLLPDFILGEFIFSEAVLYPLFFALMYCAYIYIQEGSRRCILWIGLLGGLLYSIKPGAVVPAAVFILMVFLLAAIRKNGRDALWAVGAVVIFFAAAGAFWALARYAFGYKGGALSIYSSQATGARKSEWGKVLAGYPFYFILSCGIVGFVYPAVSSQKWETEKRIFWRYILSSLAVTIIGAVWAIEQVSSVNNIYLRYVGMYIPLVMMFCFVCLQKTDNKSTSPSRLPPVLQAAIILGYTALCCLIFGCKLNASILYSHAQTSLALLNDMFLPLSMQWLGNIIILGLCGAAFYLFFRYYDKRWLGPVCITCMSVCMLINGIMGYIINHTNYYPHLAKDARAVGELTEGRPFIYLLPDEGIADNGVDVFVKQNNCIVYAYDFINNLEKNNGVYVPYTPVMMRGVASVKDTPEVDTLVINSDSIPYIKLSQYASAASPYGHTSVFVIRFLPGIRLIDSAVGNLTNHVLDPGRPGILLIFNEEYFGKPLNIKMKIESDIAQTMSIHSTHEIYDVDLLPGTNWYEVHFDQAEDGFNFRIQDRPIKVSGYELEIEE